MTQIDPNLCPLCGENNHCGVRLVEDCWCKSETFARELLESIPPEKVEKACICQNCATKSGIRSGIKCVNIEDLC